MKNTDYFQRLTAIEGSDATWRPEKDPLVLDRAKGSLVWDIEGNNFIDMIAGFGALPLGHNHGFIQEKLNEQPDALVHGMGDVCPSRYKIEFIEKLLSFLPSSYKKALLAVTGSQAVELAMKTAMLATKGSGFISFEGAYHGLDFASLALTNNRYFRGSFESWLNVENVKHLPFECEEKLIRIAIQDFLRKGIRPAGIIVEPIQGRGGFRAASIEWLKLLKKISEETKCLLIFDEVFTGFGRAGCVTFAEQVECDLICFGKAIGGGMPLSACVGSENVMNAWPINTNGEATHTGTFFGHPYSCRVGLSTLDLVKREDLINRAQKIGEKFLLKLKAELSENLLVSDVRGKGFMIAVEFKNPEHSIAVMKDLRSHGVLLIPCGSKGECISLTPALNIDTSLLDRVFDRIVDAIHRLEKS